MTLRIAFWLKRGRLAGCVLLLPRRSLRRPSFDPFLVWCFFLSLRFKGLLRTSPSFLLYTVTIFSVPVPDHSRVFSFFFFMVTQVEETDSSIFLTDLTLLVLLIFFMIENRVWRSSSLDVSCPFSSVFFSPPLSICFMSGDLRFLLGFFCGGCFFWGVISGLILCLVPYTCSPPTAALLSELRF